MKNKLTWLLWVLVLLGISVNEVSYYHASLTADAIHTVSIHSLAGCTRSALPVCGTPRYVTVQDGLIDQISMYTASALIVIIVFRSWMRRKSKAPILFPPK